MQMSMFAPGVSLPSTHEEALSFWADHLREDSADADAFTFTDVKNGHSYYFYGTMVFQVVQTAHGGAFALSGKVFRSLSFASQSRKQITDTTLHRLDGLTADQISEVVSALLDFKHSVFRSLITETFACCNDFRRCSAARQCLHPEDRFYNGCYYRKNLEAGKIFF